MRAIFGVRPRDAALFGGCAAVYVVIVMLWAAVPLVPASPASGIVVSIADSDIAFLAATGLFGDLPAQSISKLVMCVALYLVALLYALLEVGRSEHRRALTPLAALGGLSALAWGALNWWVIAGFLNARPLYGLAAAVLMLLWGGAVAYGAARLHDPLALFLVRFGLGLAMFVTIAQLAALLTPEWRSPTQGIPVLYNLTFNALVGVCLAGAGGNMRWRDRRAQELAARPRRRSGG